MLLILTALLAALASASSIPKCRVTSKDIEGPYYHPHAPKSTESKICTATSYAQDRVLITGRVISGSDCHTPVPSTLDIWHADNNGRYSSGNKNAKHGYECRSVIETDAEGRWEFYSVMPGRYEDVGGWRPAHIHFKIKPVSHAHGDEHQEITTQLYFKDDLYLRNDSCGHCASSDPTLSIEMRHLSDIKTFVGQWDIVLANEGERVNELDKRNAIVGSERSLVGMSYTSVLPHIMNGAENESEKDMELEFLREENLKLRRAASHGGQCLNIQ